MTKNEIKRRLAGLQSLQGNFLSYPSSKIHLAKEDNDMNHDNWENKVPDNMMGQGHDFVSIVLPDIKKNYLLLIFSNPLLMKFELIQ